MANCQKLCWSKMGSWQLKEFPLSKLPKGKKRDIPRDISALANLKTVLDLILSNQSLFFLFLLHLLLKNNFKTLKFKKKKNISSLADAKCSPTLLFVARPVTHVPFSSQLLAISWVSSLADWKNWSIYSSVY